MMFVNTFTFLRYFFWTYKSVFTGSELVDWLVQPGLVPSREEGVEYGHALMQGRVLAHVQEEHYFHDSGYFYQFLWFICVFMMWLKSWKVMECLFCLIKNLSMTYSYLAIVNPIVLYGLYCLQDSAWSLIDLVLPNFQCWSNATFRRLMLNHNSYYDTIIRHFKSIFLSPVFFTSQNWSCKK